MMGVLMVVVDSSVGESCFSKRWWVCLGWKMVYRMVCVVIMIERGG